MWELTLSPYDPWLNSRRGHAQGRVKSGRVSETKSNRSICCDDALGYKGTAESSFTCNSHCSWLLVQKYFSWIQQVLVPCLISVLDVSLLALPTSTSYGKCYVKWSLRESTSQVKTVLTWASVQSSYILNVINSCGVEFYSYLNWGSFKPLQPAITIPSSGPGTAVWCFFSLSLFPLSQLQHCLPVYLLLPRAHSQSSGGTQHHEPPPAPHHEVSGPAPSGCPWALFPWTEGCTQAPFWQGEAALKPFICNHFHLTYLFIPLYIKLLQYTKHRYVVPNDFYLRNESPIY